MLSQIPKAHNLQCRRISQVVGLTICTLHVRSVLGRTFTVSIMTLSMQYDIISSELKADYRFLEKIVNGDIEITAEQFPNFLYDEGVAEEVSEDNPLDWDVEKGLLRSPLCVWVSLFFFFFEALLFVIIHSRPSNASSWAADPGLQKAARRNRLLARSTVSIKLRLLQLHTRWLKYVINPAANAH
jgi:hypothetical protein